MRPGPVRFSGDGRCPPRLTRIATLVFDVHDPRLMGHAGSFLCIHLSDSHIPLASVPAFVRLSNRARGLPSRTFPPWFGFSSLRGAKRAEVPARASKLRLGKPASSAGELPRATVPAASASDSWDMERI